MDNIEKFSNKSEIYTKYRSAYPKEFIELIMENVDAYEDTITADVGAGTGILTKQLADNMKKVYAVEPNNEMRSACKNIVMR